MVYPGSIFFLSLGFEYIKHVIVEKHEVASIIPSLVFFGIVIVSLVLWTFSRIEKELKERKLAEEELRNAYEELKTLDKMKEDFINTMSHELLTPLTISKSSLNLLRDTATEDSQKELLAMTIDSINRQQMVIQDLVIMTDVAGDNLSLNIEGLNLGEIISLSRKNVENAALMKNIKINVDVPENMSINGDRYKMIHIFNNLLSNAVKFNRDGGEVIIKARQNKDHAEISIEDTGIGIAKEHLDKVFDKFYQIDSGPTRKYGGSGTGLTVVRELIKAHSRRIWLESELGKGSIFSFSIPKKKQVNVFIEHNRGVGNRQFFRSPTFVHSCEL